MSDAYIQITDASFSTDVLGSDKPVIVDFWAPWCGPCLMMAPTFEALAAEYGKSVTFAKMDTDENPQTPSRFGIMGIPTLIMFRGGQEVGRLVGLQRRDALERAIQSTFELAV